MSLGVRATRGALWTFVERGGYEILNFVFYLYLARQLGPRDFGIMAIAVALLFFFDMILRNWITDPLVRRKQVDDGHLDTAFWVNVIAASVFSLLVVAVARPVATMFGQDELAFVLMLLAPSIVLKSLIMVQLAILRREMNFRTLAIRSMLGAVGGGAVGVGMASFGFGIYSLVGRDLTAAVVALAVLWSTARWRPGRQVSVAKFWDLFEFGKHRVLNSFITYFGHRLFAPIVGYFMGPFTAGLFNIANRLNGIFAAMSGFAVSRVALSAFSQLQDNPKRLERAFYKSVEAATLVSFPIFFGLSSVAPEVTLALLSEKWRAAIPLIQIIVLGGATGSLVSCTGTLLLACNKPKWILIKGIVFTSLFLPALVISVQFSPTAVACVVVAQAYLGIPVGLYLARKVLPYNLTALLLRLLKPLTACVVMATSVYFTRGMIGDLNPILSLFLLVAAGAIAYCATILVIAPDSVRMMVNYFNAAISSKETLDSEPEDF